ncbi:MAG: TIM barrel protein [Theionarchaea archaeon]|nr:TIM barrel protein [Theionarchaea archaeon]
MRIGVAGIPVDYKKKGIIRGIEGIKDLGLDALEYQMGRGIRLTKEKAQEIGECGKQYNIEISVHAPYYLNFSVKDESLQKWTGALRQTVGLAQLMHSSITVIHPGWAVKNVKRELSLKNIISNLQEFTRVGVETMGKINAMGHFKEVLQICSNTGHIPVLDFAHIHALTPLKSKDDFLAIFEEVETELGHQNRFHTHFTAVEVSNGEEKKHLPIEEGEPHFMYLVEAVQEMGYNVTVICESPELDRDAVKMKYLFMK